MSPNVFEFQQKSLYVPCLEKAGIKFLVFTLHDGHRFDDLGAISVTPSIRMKVCLRFIHTKRKEAIWTRYQFYHPHPKDGEGNVHIQSVHTWGGGVPISHNALQHYPECHGADTWGGTHIPKCFATLPRIPRGRHLGGGGVPGQDQPGRGGTIKLWDGVTRNG